MHDLLHAYVDGELDVAHTLEVEQHLQGCPGCARVCDDIRSLRGALQAGLSRFAPPADLRPRIRAALRKGERRAIPVRWLALAASLLVLAVGAAGLLMRGPGGHDRLVQEVIDSHVRAQMASHLLDVESSDRHRVKPWFQGKLDFSPTVRDLGDEGYELLGGRLDYVGGRPVAALVYRRRRHIINLLTWPATAADRETEPRLESRQGYQVAHWQRQGMHGWAVSDLNAGELTEFARLVCGR
jgi:anti-sigma factor RsiW